MKPTTDELIKEIEEYKKDYDLYDSYPLILARLQGRLDVLEERHLEILYENINHDFKDCPCVIGQEIAKIKEVLK